MTQRMTRGLNSSINNMIIILTIKKLFEPQGLLEIIYTTIRPPTVRVDHG